MPILIFLHNIRELKVWYFFCRVELMKARILEMLPSGNWEKKLELLQLILLPRYGCKLDSFCIYISWMLSVGLSVSKRAEYLALYMRGENSASLLCMKTVVSGSLPILKAKNCIGLTYELVREERTCMLLFTWSTFNLTLLSMKLL